VAVNVVRYKYLIQKSFRALPYLIQNLKDYITKGFWKGPHLFRNHYISEFNGELYTRPYYKKYTSPDILPNYNSCKDLKELLKLSSNKTNSNLVRSNSFACGQEFPWINSRSYNENSFKEANKKKRKEMENEILGNGDDDDDDLFDKATEKLDQYVNNNITKDEIVLSQANFADLTKSQIQDIITLTYPDTESIVTIFNREQPKFYVDSDDEYDEMQEIEKQAIRNEIKKSTNSIRVLNVVDSDSESDSDEMGKLKIKN